MKVLLVSTLYHPYQIGGAERVVQRLAEALVSRGHEAVVASLCEHGDRRDTMVNGVRVHYLPLKNFYWPFSNTKPGALARAFWHAADTNNVLMEREVRELIGREKPDVMNTHNIAGFSVAIWSAAKQLTIPLVHTIHDQYLLCPSTTMFKDDRNCEAICSTCNSYSWLRRQRTELVDVVTGVSRFVIDRHLDAGCFRSSTARVIYNACPSIPEHAVRPREEAKRPGPVRFGFLGRLDVTKGIELLLDAFLRLHQGSAELWIAGKGRSDYEHALRSKTSHREEVKWLGYVPPDSLLSQIDVLVVPSQWNEPAGLVVQEAAAYGLPVIASARGGIPELIADGSGWMFDPMQPGSLAAAMTECIATPEVLATLGKRAKESSTQFTLQSMADGYLTAYRLAVERHIPTANCRWHD